MLEDILLNNMMGQQRGRDSEKQGFIKTPPVNLPKAPLSAYGTAKVVAANPNFTAINALNADGSGGGGGGSGGGFGFGFNQRASYWPDGGASAVATMDRIDYERYAGEKEAQDYYLNSQKTGTVWDTPQTIEEYKTNLTPSQISGAKNHTDTQGDWSSWLKPARAVGGGGRILPPRGSYSPPSSRGVPRSSSYNWNN